MDIQGVQQNWKITKKIQYVMNNLYVRYDSWLTEPLSILWALVCTDIIVRHWEMRKENSFGSTLDMENDCMYGNYLGTTWGEEMYWAWLGKEERNKWSNWSVYTPRPFRKLWPTNQPTGQPTDQLIDWPTDRAIGKLHLQKLDWE